MTTFAVCLDNGAPSALALGASTFLIPKPEVDFALQIG
jgi:hypothetical protein